MTYAAKSLPGPLYFCLVEGTVSQLCELIYRTEIPWVSANLKSSGDHTKTLKGWPAKALSLYYKTIKRNSDGINFQNSLLKSLNVKEVR